MLPPMWVSVAQQPAQQIIGYQYSHRHDDDAKAWYYRQYTTCFDLMAAVSFYVSNGWPTSKMNTFLEIIKPPHGWKEDNGPMPEDAWNWESDNHVELRRFLIEMHNQ